MEYRLYLNEGWGDYYVAQNPGMFHAWVWNNSHVAFSAADPHRCVECEYFHYGCPFDGQPNSKDPLSRQLCY